MATSQPQLTFDGGAPHTPDEEIAESVAQGQPKLFGEEPEMPPTWSEGSLVFHTTEKCSRLQAIRRNRRITGRPGTAMRPCFNCEDILRTKRRG